jgi:hypothetical protein
MSSAWSSIGGRQTANNAMSEPLVDTEALFGITFLVLQNVTLSGVEGCHGSATASYFDSAQYDAPIL